MLFNAERKIGADLTVVPARRLAARPVVRSHRAVVGQPVAEHAQPDPGDALSRASARSSTPTSRSAAAPISRSSRSARRGSTAARLAAALNARALPGIRFYPVQFTPASSVHAKRGLPGRVHGGDQPRRAAAGARRPRDRRGAVAAARRPVRQEDRRSGCSARAPSSRAPRPARIRRRSPPAGPAAEAGVAAPAREVPALSVAAELQL